MFMFMYKCINVRGWYIYIIKMYARSAIALFHFIQNRPFRRQPLRMMSVLIFNYNKIQISNTMHIYPILFCKVCDEFFSKLSTASYQKKTKNIYT